MRLMTVAFGLAIGLASTTALAAPAGGGAGGKGETGGKGGLGPADSTTAGAAGSAEQSPTNLDVSQQAFGGKSTQNPDTAQAAREEEKPWEVSGTFETHHLLRDQYTAEGLGQYKTFNVYFLAAKYLITDADVLSLSGGVFEFFLADQGESGFRGTDISLSYSHVFQLPEKFQLRTTGTVTAPISYDSQLASNITSPSVTVALSRRFGDLLLSAGLRGTFFWDKYTSENAIGASPSSQDPNSGAGEPNAKWNAGGFLSAEYAMPFYRQFSVGAALTDSYVWYYNVGSSPTGTTFNGATSNSVTDNSTFFQSYGGEIFARYILPNLSGFKSDITVALANGDPSLGYPSVLRDGVVHPYVLGYNSAEVYAALEGRY